MSDAAAAVETGGHAFPPRRGVAWGQLVLGWICAQGLLTLIPIAPPGWGTPALLVVGGGFAVWALLGLRRALTPRPMLVIDRAGLGVGTPLGERRIPWSAVMHWRVVAAEKRLDLGLAKGAGQGPLDLMLLRRGRLALDARLVDASLSDIVRALRATRPDLETDP